MDTNQAYYHIKLLMYQCSIYLDKTYGNLSGSTFKDNILSHYMTHPNHDTKYGLKLISVFDALQKCHQY